MMIGNAGQRPHILLVDDDTEIRSMLSKFLHDHGLTVTPAADGQDMFAALARSRIDLILLDIMMPGEDGLSLCRRLQSQNHAPPVILLTAVDGEVERILGLEIGADDYVVKPFSPRELLARIRNVLRRISKGEDRTPAPLSRSFRFAGWTMDHDRRDLVSPEGSLVVLTSTEFDLLALFVENPRQALSRDQLLEALHGRSAQPFDRTMDVQVSRLRRKLEKDPQNPELIKTLRNEGYFFTPDVERTGKS